MTRLLRFWPWAALALMAACILAMNIWCVPAHDELSYAFLGQSTPMVGEVERVHSLGDIVRQQYHDYTRPSGNGRVWTHGTVALFAGFRLYTLFDVANTAMWFLLVWLVLREGGVRRMTARTFFLGACVVWWFLWYAETCSMNAAFAVNYLWTACATVAMMALWRRANAWWWVPVAFFYGWSQETFALPMLAGLAGGALLRSVAGRRIAVTPQHAVAWALMLAGACFLCFGPAALGRAGEAADGELSTLLVGAVRSNVGLLLLGAPVLLLGALGWEVWRNRRGLWPMVLRAPEWWCALVAAWGLFCLLGYQGVVRLSMMLLLAALVIVLRERAAFRRPFPWKVCAGVAMVWLLVATAWQIVLGENGYRMLRHYRADPQGITFYAALPTGPLHYTVSHGTYNRWHRMLFRREYGHAHNPTFLTPWLHDTLYRDPPRFFAEARALADGLYVAPRAPKAVVMRGHAEPSAAQRATLARHFATVDAPPADWRRFLPGRLRVMFPAEDFHLAAPNDTFRLIAADGRPYTLFLPPKQHP